MYSAKKLKDPDDVNLMLTKDLEEIIHYYIGLLIFQLYYVFWSLSVIYFSICTVKNKFCSFIHSAVHYFIFYLWFYDTE